MSNLDNIINKIISDTEDKIKILNSETEDKIQVLKSEFDLKVKDYEKKSLNKFEAKKDLEFERVESNVNLKAKNILLEKKQKIIKEILDELLTNLENISLDEMENFIKYNLENRKSFPNELIFVSPKYADLSNKFSNIKIKEDIKSGFVISYEGVDENYTFESIMNIKKEELESLILNYFN
ncbi:MAG: V-type ATP synthase subunit E [Streptobacillus sp.]